MVLRTLRDALLENKRILVRVDFNVPINKGVVTDDTRIRASLPTLEYILSRSGARVILMSHLGRPKGKRDPNYSLRPVAHQLEALIKRRVQFAEDCVGPLVKEAARKLPPGELLMLENVRFHVGENTNDSAFVDQLASLGELYINDAFGSAHRAHASTEGVGHSLPSYAGFLIEKEVRFFTTILDAPERPLMAIIGGAKISSKIGVLESLLNKVDVLVIGGAMAYTFLKAQGHTVGDSVVEDDYLNTAHRLLREFKARKHLQVVLASDHVTARNFSERAEPHYIETVDIPDGEMGLDIGKKTIRNIIQHIEKAKTIVWNGPLGVFEFSAFANGTLEIARQIAASDTCSIVGGGDSVAAINTFGLSDSISHISTGGGASLEFLEGKKLPGIAILYNK